MSSPTTDPPRPSEQSQRWLKGVRAQVKARLFGSPNDSIGSGHTFAAEQTVPSAEAIVDPTRIGRFVVIKRIGQGGMGVIYAAYDDQLDRKVAVKLLRPDGGGGTGTDGRARLVREAQALARLSHESVIAVYEVGTFEDQVYVAMEFVDGGTLKAWQNQANRPWRDVLHCYVASGRGLAAAHAAGIVHRDFKPDNVLVRRDGGVRVVDFGLARREFEGPTPEGDVLEALGDSNGENRLELADLATSSVLSLADLSGGDAPLTRTGVIMGTPAYMAPEQHLGMRADARSDQFAYCVSLYEALYGFRPFAGNDLPTLRRTVLTGSLQDPPKYTDIPPRIYAVLERGLHVNPDARHPSMESLLEDLTRNPQALMWKAAIGMVFGMLLVVGGWVYWSATEARGVRAEGQSLRQRFEKARVVTAEAELRRAQRRSVSEKWDDVILSYAREVVTTNPTKAIAALKHLTADHTHWLPAARTIAADALRRGIVFRQLRGPGENGFGRIDALRFAPDTGELFFAGGTGVVHRWTPGAVTATTIGTTSSSIRGIDVDDSGRRVIAVCSDGTTHLWELGDEEQHRTLPPTTGPLTAVALSPDGSVFVTGSKKGTLDVLAWSGKFDRTLNDHDGPIRGLDISRDAKTVVSGSDDGDIILWYLDRRTHLELGDHNSGVGQAFFTENDERLLSVSEDGEVRFWATSSGKGTVQIGFDPIRALYTAAERAVSLTIDMDQNAFVLGPQNTRARLEGLPAAATAAAMRPDGGMAAVASGDGSVLLWKLAQGNSAAVFPDGAQVAEAAGAITAVAWDPEGRRVATGTGNGSVDIWHRDGSHERRLGQLARGVVELSFSPEGHTVAGLDEEGVLLVWPVADAPRPHMASPLGQRVRWTLAWSPDGSEVAAAECQARCTIALHDLSGDVRLRLPETPRPADHMRYSQDGKWLASEHDDGPRLWDVTHGEAVPLSWPDDTLPARRIAFVFTEDTKSIRFATTTTTRDDDGRKIASTLRVWQAGIESGDVHLLFEEPDLSLLLADDDFVTLLLRTKDDRTLLWTLDDDGMRMLPAFPAGYERLIVAPGRDALLLTAPPETKLAALWTHVDTGQSREFPPLHQPLAWSPNGVIADVGAPSELRVWLDATPDSAPAFSVWLDQTTNATLDPSTIR